MRTNYDKYLKKKEVESRDLKYIMDEKTMDNDEKKLFGELLNIYVCDLIEVEDRNNQI